MGCFCGTSRRGKRFDVSAGTTPPCQVGEYSVYTPAQVLDFAETICKPGVTTDFIDQKVHKMIIDNGEGVRDPIKHVVSVNPGTVVYMETEVDAPGQWAFHCHLSYHADSGMFRKIIVEGGPERASLDPASKG